MADILSSAIDTTFDALGDMPLARKLEGALGGRGAVKDYVADEAAQVGPALSRGFGAFGARIAGGEQGFIAYMNNIAKQEETESQRAHEDKLLTRSENFKREMFELEHGWKLDAEGRDKQARLELQAQASSLAADNAAAAQAAMEAFQRGDVFPHQKELEKLRAGLKDAKDAASTKRKITSWADSPEGFEPATDTLVRAGWSKEEVALMNPTERGDALSELGGWGLGAETDKHLATEVKRGKDEQAALAFVKSFMSTKDPAKNHGIVTSRFSNVEGAEKLPPLKLAVQMAAKIRRSDVGQKVNALNEQIANLDQMINNKETNRSFDTLVAESKRIDDITEQIAFHSEGEAFNDDIPATAGIINTAGIKLQQAKSSNADAARQAWIKEGQREEGFDHYRRGGLNSPQAEKYDFNTWKEAVVGSLGASGIPNWDVQLSSVKDLSDDTLTTMVENKIVSQGWADMVKRIKKLNVSEYGGNLSSDLLLKEIYDDLAQTEGRTQRTEAAFGGPRNSGQEEDIWNFVTQRADQKFLQDGTLRASKIQKREKAIESVDFSLNDLLSRINPSGFHGAGDAYIAGEARERLAGVDLAEQAVMPLTVWNSLVADAIKQDATGEVSYNDKALRELAGAVVHSHFEGRGFSPMFIQHTGGPMQTSIQAILNLPKDSKDYIGERGPARTFLKELDNALKAKFRKMKNINPALGYSPPEEIGPQQAAQNAADLVTDAITPAEHTLQNGPQLIEQMWEILSNKNLNLQNLFPGLRLTEKKSTGTVNFLNPNANHLYSRRAEKELAKIGYKWGYGTRRGKNVKTPNAKNVLKVWGWKTAVELIGDMDMNLLADFVTPEDLQFLRAGKGILSRDTDLFGHLFAKVGEGKRSILPGDDFGDTRIITGEGSDISRFDKEDYAEKYGLDMFNDAFIEENLNSVTDRNLYGDSPPSRSLSETFKRSVLFPDMLTEEQERLAGHELTRMTENIAELKIQARQSGYLDISGDLSGRFSKIQALQDRYRAKNPSLGSDPDWKRLDSEDIGLAEQELNYKKTLHAKGIGRRITIERLHTPAMSLVLGMWKEGTQVSGDEPTTSDLDRQAPPLTMEEMLAPGEDSFLTKLLKTLKDSEGILIDPKYAGENTLRQSVKNAYLRGVDDGEGLIRMIAKTMGGMSRAYMLSDVGKGEVAQADRTTQLDAINSIEQHIIDTLVATKNTGKFANLSLSGIDPSIRPTISNADWVKLNNEQRTVLVYADIFTRGSGGGVRLTKKPGKVAELEQEK